VQKQKSLPYLVKDKKVRIKKYKIKYVSNILY